MRLLLVTHYYSEHRGGIEIVAGELAKRLANRGIRIRWVASAENLSASDTAIQRVPMREWNITERRLGFPYPLWGPESLRRLHREVADADVVHIHDSLYFGNYFAYRYARQLARPLVVTQHIGAVPYSSPVLRTLLHLANRTVARRVLSGADQVVFISPRVQDFFRRFVRFPAAPRFIPNGVDTQRFRPSDQGERTRIRGEFGLMDQRPTLLFVGRFVEKKGLPILREVASRMPEADFIFAGWGAINPRSWNLPNVRCVGSLTGIDLVRWYTAADLLVLPSVGEGFPLVVQEAAACGTSAIITHETASGYPGIEGIIHAVEPNALSVEQRCRALLADPAKLLAQREWVAQRAHAIWDWDRCAAEYAKLFEELQTR